METKQEFNVQQSYDYLVPLSLTIQVRRARILPCVDTGCQLEELRSPTGRDGERESDESMLSIQLDDHDNDIIVL